MRKRQRNTRSNESDLQEKKDATVNGKLHISECHSSAAHPPSTMKRLLGFDGKSLSSYAGYVGLCHAPTDPSNLAVFRILFGMLMFDCFFTFHCLLYDIILRKLLVIAIGSI